MKTKYLNISHIMHSHYSIVAYYCLLVVTILSLSWLVICHLINVH